MAEKRKPAQKHTTPILRLGKFPKLVEPDEYQGKRKFKAEGILSADEAASLIARIDALMPEARKLYAAALKDAQDKARKAGKKLTPEAPKEHLPYYEVIDPDTGQETGDFAFKFSTAAEWTDREGKTHNRLVPFFSASGTPIVHKAKPDMWSGSRVRFSYTLGAFGNLAAGIGVSLRIEAVKVIQVQGKGSGGQASDYGFGGAEDGYEGEDGAEDGDDQADTGESPAGQAGDDDGEPPPF